MLQRLLNQGFKRIVPTLGLERQSLATTDTRHLGHDSFGKCAIGQTKNIAQAARSNFCHDFVKNMLSVFGLELFQGVLLCLEGRCSDQPKSGLNKSVEHYKPHWDRMDAVGAG